MVYVSSLSVFFLHICLFSVFVSSLYAFFIRLYCLYMCIYLLYIYCPISLFFLYILPFIDLHYPYVFFFRWFLFYVSKFSIFALLLCIFFLHIISFLFAFSFRVHLLLDYIPSTCIYSFSIYIPIYIIFLYISSFHLSPQLICLLFLLVFTPYIYLLCIYFLS